LADKLKLLIVAQHLEGGGAEKILYRLILNLHEEINIKVVTLYKRGRYLEEILSIPGIEYDCINAEEGNTINFAARLRKIIIKTKLLSFLYYQNILTYLAMLGLNTPFILSERSNHRIYLTDSLKHKLWKWLLGKSYRRAFKIVTVSEESKAAIIADFIVQREKIITIYNGLSFPLIDGLKEEPVTDLDFKKEFRYIVAVGSLSKAKNYPLLINSFSILNLKHKNTRLLILGKGEMEDQIKRIISGLNLTEEISLPGYCFNPYKYLRYGSCYVLSSSWEGFPNSLLEAMYVNGHVVSTNCQTGPAEIISNNEDGILCEPDNPEELAVAMERMCFDEDFRKKVFDNSRKKIAKFDEKIMVQEYRNLLMN
jgi:glycosyltransferase involved in cell wall biosynthesis